MEVSVGRLQFQHHFNFAFTDEEEVHVKVRVVHHHHLVKLVELTHRAGVLKNKVLDDRSQITNFFNSTAERFSS